MAIRQRLRSLLWRVPIDQEVQEELDHHIELRTQELIDKGVDPIEARAQARRRIEEARVGAELTRLGRKRNTAWARRDWLDELRQDLRFAFRQLRAKPGFTLAAVLTLALGLGATTAIFSVVHAVVLKPYAYADPDRVLLTFSLIRGNRGSWSVGNFDYFRQRLTTTVDISPPPPAPASISPTTASPSASSAARVTLEFFPLFGIPPAHGRTFTADEDQPGRTNVVVLSDRLWRRRFGADPAMVGRSIRMNGEPLRRDRRHAAGVRSDRRRRRSVGADRRSRRRSWRCTTSSTWTSYARQKPDVSLAAGERRVRRASRKSLAVDHPGHESRAQRRRRAC